MAKAKRRYIVMRVSMLVKVHGCDKKEKMSVRDQEQNLSLSYDGGCRYIKEFLITRFGDGVTDFKSDIMATNSKLIKRMAKKDLIAFLPEEWP